MPTCLSDIRFTEREIRTVRETVDAIRKEARRETPRPVRISNLCDRISLTVVKAERRMKWADTMTR
jgi:hypothetical protein